MNEPRYRKLADLLTGYSTCLRRGDRVWIDASEIPEDFVVELIRSVRARGAGLAGQQQVLHRPAGHRARFAVYAESA